jgi:hypothetical protein
VSIVFRMICMLSAVPTDSIIINSDESFPLHVHKTGQKFTIL